MGTNQPVSQLNNALLLNQQNISVTTNFPHLQISGHGGITNIPLNVNNLSGSKSSTPNISVTPQIPSVEYQKVS